MRTLATALAFAALIAPSTAAADQITLDGPGATTRGHQVTFSGRLSPPAHGVRVGVYLGSSVVGWTTTNDDGSFIVRPDLFTEGAYRARTRGAVSPQHTVKIVEAGGQPQPPPDGNPAAHPLESVTLDGPGATRRGHQVTFSGRISPPAGGVRVGIYLGSSVVARTHTNPNGTYVARPSLFRPGEYRARTLSAISPTHSVDIVAAPKVSILERLHALGYSIPPPGDRSAGAIRQSVYAFQKAQGIGVDGIVGPVTAAKLRHPDRVRPRASTPADHLEVDTDRQLLLVVRGGDVQRIVNTSTAGIPGYTTPEGTFHVFRRVEGLDTSPLGRLWDPLYFYRGWAIHGSTNVPPHPASHGCVRVPMWSAERLFDDVDHGEAVYVY